VTAFKMTVIPHGKDPILDMPSENSQLTDRMRSLIKTLHPGDRVFIDGNKSKMTTGTYQIPVPLQPMAFTIN